MDKKRQILSALESYFIHKAEIYHIDMVFLYGSWATGLPKIESDVDIAVVFDKEMGREELGVPVYIKSFTRYVDKRLYAIYQMEDFSIFGTKWQAEILEKRMEKLNKVNSQEPEDRIQEPE